MFAVESFSVSVAWHASLFLPSYGWVRMLNVTTDSIEKMFQQAGACWAAGRLREAESLCMRLLSVYPQHVKALCMMGDIAVRAGAYERAEALVRQAIAFEPGAVDAYNILGNALRPMERMTEA